MKQKAPLSIPVGMAIACLLSFGAMGSMITGLDLPVNDLRSLHLAWSLAALAGCVLSMLKRGQIPTLILTIGIMWYLWEYHHLSLPIRALISRLSWVYDSAYGWGMVEFVGVDWRKIPLDLPLGVFGCLIALTGAESMIRGGGLIAPVGLAILPLTASLIVTNTVPDPVWLYMLIFAIAQLALTATVRRQNPRQGAKLALLTTLPVSLLMGLLFTAYPKDTYVNRSEEQLDAVVDWWRNLSLFSGDTTGLISQAPSGPGSSASTNLRRVGPRNIRAYPVMEVTAERGGVIYLRGQDFDDYDGLSWNSSALRSEVLRAPQGPGSTVTVKTLRPMNVLYNPYYPADGQLFVGGRVPNTDDLTEYSFRITTAMEMTYFDSTLELGQAVIIDEEIEAIAGVGSPDDLDEADLRHRYTLLTEQTLGWAKPYLSQIFRSVSADMLDNGDIARIIADHVRNSAVYDTDTARMDPDDDDFARWFLEESDTGYCVHFATAAAVLLRAAGVPARYVTGYMVSCEAGEAATVTADMAHAWVEYYEEGIWHVLEPTPPDLREEETEPDTEAPSTAPPTEPPTDAGDETRPDGPGPMDKDKVTLNLKPLWTALKWLVGMAAAVLVFFGQYRLRRKLRRPGRGSNAKALALWQDVEAICRATKQEPPEDLYALAEKAKFSQHRLTAEELSAFETWLETQRSGLKQKPWHLRLMYQYVLALW